MNLALHVMGHVVKHDGVRVADVVLSEDSEELVAGIGGRVEACGTHGA